MRSEQLALLALLATACATNPLAGGDDAGSTPDLARLADGATPDGRSSCADVAATVKGWLDAHATCQMDSDCGSLYTNCGLAGQCGGYYNKAASGAHLSLLLEQWKQSSCDLLAACPPCVPLQGVPGCLGGVCGAKLLGGAAVGDPCTKGADCASGQCIDLGASKLFFGGYCTVIDCENVNKPCPKDSTCKRVGDGHSYCLKDCNPSLNKIQCRNAMGYACCGGPDPGGKVGWCAPQNSPLCQGG
ncbi:MAG: hypothetical protein EXR72_11230 [Myxococcales bacterium]|nr:hypothetical protein [Myxococcales bacterium]